eukprot:scaffold154984_cov31-Tisochrysis_lutea.AAC.4
MTRFRCNSSDGVAHGASAVVPRACDTLRLFRMNKPCAYQGSVEIALAGGIASMGHTGGAIANRLPWDGLGPL